MLAQRQRGERVVLHDRVLEEEAPRLRVLSEGARHVKLQAGPRAVNDIDDLRLRRPNESALLQRLLAAAFDLGAACEIVSDGHRGGLLGEGPVRFAFGPERAR